MNCPGDQLAKQRLQAAETSPRTPRTEVMQDLRRKQACDVPAERAVRRPKVDLQEYLQREYMERRTYRKWLTYRPLVHNLLGDRLNERRVPSQLAVQRRHQQAAPPAVRHAVGNQQT